VAVKRFLKEMAQPVDSKQLHEMLLSEAQLKDKRHAGTAPVVQNLEIIGKVPLAVEAHLIYFVLITVLASCWVTAVLFDPP